MNASGSQTPGLRRRLARGEVVHGLIVKMPGPATIETAAHAGFDFVVIDTEHGPGDDELLEHHIRAARASNIQALVRVPDSNASRIGAVLDAGAVGVVAPHISDSAAAAKVLSAAHYPPVGARSFALSTSAGHHGFLPAEDHIRRAGEETVVVVQFEDGRASEHVAALASLPNLDAIFIGPADLSMTLGFAGDTQADEVRAAIDQAVDAIAKAGNAALCVLADDADAAITWRKRGAQMILLSATNVFSRELERVSVALRDNGVAAGAAGPTIEKGEHHADGHS